MKPVLKRNIPNSSPFLLLQQEEDLYGAGELPGAPDRAVV